MKNQSGFTFIEIIITLGIVGILFAVSGVALSRLQQSITSRASDKEVLAILSNASRKARHGSQGSSWGVFIPYNETTRSTGTITVFSGTSYATRTAVNDLVYSVNTDIHFSSVNFSGTAPDAVNDHEIVFNALTGATTQYGSLTLEWYGSTRILNVSADGIVSRE
ncbi:MAG: type II secretion system protein [Patescibacteria group bacterium]